MRYWVCALSLGCANAPEPTAPEPVPVAQAPVVVVPAPPVGPSRLEVLERMKSVKQASYRVLGAGWTRVGTHREERVLKPVNAPEPDALKHAGQVRESFSRLIRDGVYLSLPHKLSAANVF